MRILFIHADVIEFEAREKTKYAVDVPPERLKGRMEDALVAFVSAEERDEGHVADVAGRATAEVEDVASQVKTRRVVLYPYAHLSPTLARPEEARKIIDAMYELLHRRGYELLAPPFGWYKAFTLQCKGHPLAELSREVVAGEAKGADSQAVRAEAKLVSHWHVLEPDGTLHALRLEGESVKGFDFGRHEQLRKFARYEMAKQREAKQEPPHIRAMRKLELVDYEPGSDPGNLRFYPKGRLVKALLEDYVTRRVVEYGGMEMESPIMYDYEHPSLKSYLERFPARQYIVQTPNKRAFLRFAACFGQFLMAHDMTFSYRHLPLRLYELTRYSFRAEQRGELAGMRRLRAFTMPDCHAFVSDVAMAKEEMLRRWDLMGNLMATIGFAMPDDLEVGLRVTKDFWEQHRDFVVELARRWGKPVLLEMWDEQFFYFVLKYEWNFVDAQDKAAALNTDQIDTENAARYGITYAAADGQPRNPLILHMSPSGAIERVVYALLEKALRNQAAGKPPMLPVWLSPVQVRVIPVGSEHLEYARRQLAAFDGLRADLDDTGDTVSKAVRRAEQEWVPYIAVVGEQEVKAGTLNVRVRATKATEAVTAATLADRIRQETAGLPTRPLPLPVELSRRPTFAS